MKVKFERHIMKSLRFFSLSLMLPVAFTTNAMRPAPHHVAIPRPTCHPCMPFEHDPNAIARTRHFKAILNPLDQRNPGRMFLTTHEHFASLRDLSNEHWVEFGAFLKTMHNAIIKGLYPYQPNLLLNVACLMNLARAEGTHTHWHIIPRPEGILGLIDPMTNQVLEFRDDAHGKPYDFNVENYRRLLPSMNRLIIKNIQDNLDLTNIQEAKLAPLPRQYKNIIFDFGGVLLADGPRYFATDRTMFAPEVSAQLLAAYKSVHWKNWHRGQISQDQLLKELAAYSAPEDITKLLSTALAPTRGYIDETVELIKKLKARGYKLYVLSNLSRESYQAFIVKNPELFDLFDGKLFSWQIGLLKPEKEVYQKCLETFALDPKESVFIDDVQENVLAAEQVGITGIVYKPGTLENELAKLALP